MELDKIRNLSSEELKSEEAKAAEQLFRIRFLSFSQHDFRLNASG